MNDHETPDSPRLWSDRVRAPMEGVFRSIAFAAALQSLPVHAGPQGGIAEYFNGYGEESRRLAGLGEEWNGWMGPWRSHEPNYLPGKNLEYYQGLYSILGNGTEPGDGLAVYGSGDSSSVCFRDFAEPLDGTIWISFVATTRADGSDAILWLRGDSELKETSARTFVALRTPSLETVAVVRYDGRDLTGDRQFARAEPHLLLCRIVMNADGVQESIALWIDPNISLEPGGLGDPDVQIADADVLGDHLTGIGVSFSYGGSMDAIRISNRPEAFGYVVSGETRGAP